MQEKERKHSLWYCPTCMASMWKCCLLFAHVFPICRMAEKYRSVFVGDFYFLCHLAFSIESGECYNRFTMAQHPTAVTFASNQPLIGIPFEENGQEVVRYFAEEALADQAVSSDATQDALTLAGAWRDLDFNEMMQELDRIRHETPPTPPIELDL